MPEGMLGRGLYRRWGIAPRPEDKGFSCFLTTLYNIPLKNASPKISLYKKERMFYNKL